MSYRIERDANTGLWVVLFEGINLRSLPGGNRLGRGAEPIIAINLAIQKVDQVNDPVTGAGPGSIPPLTSAVREQLLAQAAVIEDEERRQFERSQRDQGPGTVSAGTIVSQGQQAGADRANTQDPSSPAQSVTATGDIVTTTTATVPTNADRTQSAIPTVPSAPSKLPAGEVGGGNANTNGPVPVALGQQSPTAARQSVSTNLDQPQENTNLVSYIYKAIEVTSNFRQGKFTQEITGAQIFFPISSQTRSVTTAAPNSTTAPARPQTTVAATVATPGALGTTNGVSFRGQVGAELGAFFDDGTTGDPGQRLNPNPVQRTLPSSTFEAEGFGDPTATQESPPAQAALQTRPPTTGSTPATAVNVAPTQISNLAATGGGANQQALQDQLRAARRELRENQLLLADTQQRIDRGTGDPILNRDLRNLHLANIQRLQAQITRLEAEINNPVGSTNNQTNVAPQQGAKEY